MNKLLIIYYYRFAAAAHFMKNLKDQGSVVFRTDLISTNDIPRDTDSLSSLDVKKYIKKYCENHGKPRWILLMGNSKLIPTHKTKQNNIENSSMENVGDIFYGQLDDDPMGIPSIGIGRFPAESEVDVRNMVGKTTMYNRNHNNGALFNDPFYSTFAMVSGALDLNSEKTLSTVCTMVNSNSYSVKSIPGDLATTEALLSTVQGGSVVVCHRGAAGRDGWHDPVFTSSQLSKLNPDGVERHCLPLILSINSESGSFDGTQNSTNSSGDNKRPWAEELIKLKNNGAIGIIGACRPTIEADDNTLMLGMFEALCPPAGEVPKKFLGDILNEGKRKVLNSDASPEAKRQQITIYNLIGDPSLSVAVQASPVM